MENYETHREMFNLPDFVFPVGMLCLGYYPESVKRIPKSRFDEKYIVFDEEYKRLSNDDFKDMFRRLESRISKDNSIEAKNWGQFMYAKKTGSDFSKEMARSVKEALKYWNGKRL